MNTVMSTKYITRVEDEYGLQISEFHNFTDGMLASTSLLQTDKGKRVIKIYPTSFPYDPIAFQAQASNSMRANGVPTPIIYPNRNDSLVSSLGNHHYILMEYMTGQYPDTNSSEILELSYSALHLALSALQGLGNSDIPVSPSVAITLEEHFRQLQENIAQGLLRDEHIQTYLPRLERICSEHQDRYERIPHPRQIILGDFNVYSLLVEGSKISGIIDFDKLQLGYRAFDFMHTFDNLYITKTGASSELEDRVRWDKLRKSIQFYQTLDPSIEGEIDIFPLTLQRLALYNILSTCNEEARNELPNGYFEEKKREYTIRLEIPTQLEDKFIEELKEGLK